MSLLFPLHPGPSNTVRVLANAGVTDATSRKTMRRAAPTVCCGGTCAPFPFHVTGGQRAAGQGVVVYVREGICDNHWRAAKSPFFHFVG
ncbi:unnamed protein product [Spirodela intermedia]|uniref:Uncharacterized protein n=1 Tax=Spirodela intermedia TaxID=51605 RepID=A0A7I8KAH9_SPIIN|nr:unnamed protein product [Spirodela intermedia]